jgi:hypothetical protein
MKGFYAVYSEIFHLLDEEEAAAQTEEEPYQSAPPFGDSKTPYKEVKKFYSYWSNFITIRSFAFKDKYKTTEVILQIFAYLEMIGSKSQNKEIDGKRQQKRERQSQEGQK